MEQMITLAQVMATVYRMLKMASVELMAGCHTTVDSDDDVKAINPIDASWGVVKMVAFGQMGA